MSPALYYDPPSSGRLPNFFLFLMLTVRNLNACRSSRVFRARPGCRTARLLSAQRESRTPSSHSMTRAFASSSLISNLLSWHSSNIGLCSVLRRKSDIDNERLPPVEERKPPTSSPSPSPSPLRSTNGGTGTGMGTGMSASRGVSAGAGPGSTDTALGVPPATPFRRTRERRGALTQRR